MYVSRHLFLVIELTISRFGTLTGIGSMPETTAGRILGNTILNTKGDKIRHKGNKLVQILAFEINRATMITNIS